MVAPVCGRQWQDRTRRNVIDSDSTLILNFGALVGGTRKTVQRAQRLGKPYHFVPLDSGVRDEDVSEVVRWMAEHGIVTLNVAGPRESERHGIYRLTLAFLDTMQNLGA